MMPDRIGIIGKTQGVSASSRPKPKKLSTMSQVLPPARVAVIWSVSDSGGAGWSPVDGWVPVISTAFCALASAEGGAAAATAGNASLTCFFIGG